MNRSLLASAPLVFALVLSPALTGAAAAGVRVNEPSPVSLVTMPGVPVHSNLQLAFGPAAFASSPGELGGTMRASWSSGAALEIASSPGLSWILRGEYARFEKESTIGILHVEEFIPSPNILTSRVVAQFGSIELGTRFTTTSGSARPYVELTTGLGLRDQRTRPNLGDAPRVDGGNDGLEWRGAFGAAVGEAWQSVRTPLGVFGELRMSAAVGPHSAVWLAPRVGLLMHG